MAAFPALERSLPLIRLASLPTSVERHRGLGAALGLESLFVKRDDRSSDSYGGGKVRKLELLLARVVASGCRRVVTVGGAGSNHTLATALFARRLGLDALLLLAPQRSSEALRYNLMASLAAGATLRAYSSQHQAEAVMKRVAADETLASCAIEAGGSSALGNAGFVNAAFELRDQVRAGLLPEPRWLFVAMGTGGCAAGLSVGLAAAGLATEVVAVRASSVATSSRRRLAAMCRRTAAALGELDGRFPLSAGERVPRIDGGELGAGYARPTPAGRAALRLAQAHGIELDLSYTAKCLAAVARAAKGGDPLRPTDTVLFWHTHNSRPLDVLGADPRQLPQALRHHFVEQLGSEPARRRYRAL